jgi:hypothetical protein
MNFIPSIRALDQAIPGSTETGTAALVGMQALYGVRSTWKLVSGWSNAIIYDGKEAKLNDSFLKQKAAGWIAFTLLDNMVMRGVARVCLVTSRLIYCAEKKASFSNACESWSKFAFEGDFHHSIKVIDPSELHPFWQTLFSASTLCTVQVYYQTVSQRIEKIAFFTFQVIKEGFLLCMAYMDAYEAFTLSTEVSDEALKDVFVNLFYIKNKLIENEADVMSYIRDNENSIANVSKICGVPFDSAAQTIAGVSIAAIKKMDAIGSSIDASVTKGTVNLLQRSADSLGGLFGFAGSFDCIIPKECAPSKQDGYIKWQQAATQIIEAY